MFNIKQKETDRLIQKCNYLINYQHRIAKFTNGIAISLTVIYGGIHSINFLSAFSIFIVAIILFLLTSYSFSTGHINLAKKYLQKYPKPKELSQNLYDQMQAENQSPYLLATDPKVKIEINLKHLKDAFKS